MVREMLACMNGVKTIFNVAEYVQHNILTILNQSNHFLSVQSSGVKHIHHHPSPELSSEDIVIDLREREREREREKHRSTGCLP